MANDTQTQTGGASATVPVAPAVAPKAKRTRSPQARSVEAWDAAKNAYVPLQGNADLQAAIKAAGSTDAAKAVFKAAIAKNTLKPGQYRIIYTAWQGKAEASQVATVVKLS